MHRDQEIILNFFPIRYSLTHNSISGSGVSVLADALKVNQSLQKLEWVQDLIYALYSIITYFTLAISKYFEVVTVNQCQIRTLYVRAVMKWCIAYGMQDAHNNIVLQYGSNLNDKPLTGTIKSRKTYLKLTPHVFMKKSKLVNTLQLVKVEVYLYRWDPNCKGKLLPYSIISPCSHVEGKSCSVIHIHCIHSIHAINYLHIFSISQSLCIELYCATACWKLCYTHVYHIVTVWGVSNQSSGEYSHILVLVLINFSYDVISKGTCMHLD